MRDQPNTPFPWMFVAKVVACVFAAMACLLILDWYLNDSGFLRDYLNFIEARLRQLLIAPATIQE